MIFCDIRGFTTYSEETDEAAVVSALNEHFAAMDDAIRTHEGMINKFLGDGFMALFGVPVPVKSPALAAVRCALDIIESNRMLNSIRRDRGDQEFRIGIGVHVGPVIAGTIGSEHRLEYTAIGDTVNLASRIEGLTKRLNAEVIMTEQVAGSVRDQIDIPLVDLGEVAVRGRRQSVRIWTTSM